MERVSKIDRLKPVHQDGNKVNAKDILAASHMTHLKGLVTLAMMTLNFL